MLNPAWQIEPFHDQELGALDFPPGCTMAGGWGWPGRFNPRHDSLARHNAYFPVCQYGSGDISCETDGAELSANSCIPPTCRTAQPSREQCLADCVAAGKGTYYVSPFSTGRAELNGYSSEQFVFGHNFPSCAMVRSLLATQSGVGSKSCPAAPDTPALLALMHVTGMPVFLLHIGQPKHSIMLGRVRGRCQWLWWSTGRRGYSRTSLHVQTRRGRQRSGVQHVCTFKWPPPGDCIHLFEFLPALFVVSASLALGFACRLLLIANRARKRSNNCRTFKTYIRECKQMSHLTPWAVAG